MNGYKLLNVCKCRIVKNQTFSARSYMLLIDLYPKIHTTSAVHQGCKAEGLLTRAAMLHGCTAARLHGCMAARLHSCMQGCMQGGTAAWLQGCTAAWLLIRAARLSEPILLQSAVLLVQLSCNS